EVMGLARDGPPAVDLDIELLEVGDAAVPTDEELEEQLKVASGAYRGQFLEGVRFEDAPELEEWVATQRTYWQHQVEHVLGRLATLQLGRRALAEASATARRWLGLDALSEPAYRIVMRALAGVGERAAALAAYEECRGALREELALEPSPETVALAERLRRLPSQASSSLRSGPLNDLPAKLAAPAVTLPFVGREREFAALVAAYQKSLTGQVQVVVLEGEAGVGKTRLAEEFLRWAALEGAEVLRGRGYEARGNFPYQPLVEGMRPRLAHEHAPEDLVADVWLTELVRLFPELRERYPDLPPPAALAGDEDTGQGRLFEAVLQLTYALAERARPAALVLYYDDVQWIDLAMRDLLLYCLQRQPEVSPPYLLLLAVQTEAIATAPELEGWLVRLARQVPTAHLTLGLLNQAETAQALATVLADSNNRRAEQDLQVGSWLYTQTDGQPFYLVETLRALVDGGTLVPQGSLAGADRPPLLALAPGVDRLPRFVPGRVRELIRGQLDGLRQPALELLAAAAVLGTEATFERLCHVAALDEGAGLAALDELRRRQLLVEDAADPNMEDLELWRPATMRFPHDLVREVVYTEAGDARRRVFHRRAVALLEGTSTSAAELAHHALAAGLFEPAFRSSVTAGDDALEVFAVRDAIGHYERAQRMLTGLEPRPSPVTSEQCVHLHLRLGRAYEWVGAWAQARVTYDALRHHARGAGDATLEGRAITRLSLLTWRDSWDIVAACGLAKEAISTLEGTEDRHLLAQASWVASYLNHIAGKPDVTHRLAQQAEEMAQAAGHRELVASSLMMRGMGDIQSGDWDEGITALQRGGALYTALEGGQSARSRPRESTETPSRAAFYPWMGPVASTGYIVGGAACQAFEGFASICRGEPQRGLELGQTALRLGMDSANAAVEGISRRTVSTGLIEAGNYAEALQVGQPGVEQASGVDEPIVPLLTITSWAYAQLAILDLEEAQLAVAQALTHAEQVGIDRWIVVPRSLHCATLALAGDWAGAYAKALQTIATREILPERLLPLDFTRHHEIEVLVRGDNHARALADVRRLEKRLRHDGSDRRYWLVYERMRAALARGEGEIEATRRHLATALDMARQIGLPGEEWTIAAELASAYRPDSGLATKAFAQARTVIESLATGSPDQRVSVQFRAAALERARQLAG
ncbi:MAG: hypothetical protein JWO42_2396, partial [Chloroflexi bacterium]|nr:hypothetical protein [Chloroflexota bacterium]